MEKIRLKSRIEVQEWLSEKTEVPKDDIAVIVAGGEPGFSLICAYDLGRI